MEKSPFFMRKISEWLMAFGLFASGVFFGGMRPFSFLPLMFVFLLVFITALLSGEIEDNVKKTLRFPLFWLGICFSVYIFVQGLNPWAAFIERAGYIDIYYKDFYRFLASGLEATNSNGLASASVVAMVLLVTFAVSALNILISSYEDCLRYCAAIAVGGFTCALAGILQYFLVGNFHYMLNLFERGHSTPFGTFFYRNQAGAYMLIGICATAALFGKYAFSYDSNCKKRAVICSLCLFAISVAVFAIFISLSASAALLCLLLLPLLLVICLCHAFSRLGLRYFVASFGAISLFVGIAIVAIAFNPNILGKRFVEKFNDATSADSFAVGLNKAGGGRETFKAIALKMTMDGGYYNNEISDFQKASKIVFGSGANSFGNVSQAYISNDKRFYSENFTQGGVRVPKVVKLDYAHSDFIQFAFEYGLIWLGVLFMLFSFWVGLLFVGKFWKSAFLTMLAVSVPMTMLYSLSDIIFYNPLISLNVLAVGVIAAKYSCFMRLRNRFIV